MKYSYYPGCSLELNASAYDVSAKAVAKPVGLDLMEIEDWNCCGATEYISLNQLAAFSLIARNLVKAKQQQLGTLVAPCSACFLNLSKVESYLTGSEKLRNNVNVAMKAGGLEYTPGGLKVRHLLDIFVNDVGYEKIAELVTQPLKGLRIAPYYGCMIVRPVGQDAFDDPEYPTTLDKLMQVLGAKVVDFPLKAQCCGGHMTQISQPTAMDLLNRLLHNASEYQADMIVTLCPMCQLNLDAYQNDVNKFYKTNYHIPVLYFTQLIGLAWGMKPEELGFGKEFISAAPVLKAKLGVEVPEPEAEAGKKKRPSKEELPMPRMPGEAKE